MSWASGSTNQQCLYALLLSEGDTDVVSTVTFFGTPIHGRVLLASLFQGVRFVNSRAVALTVAGIASAATALWVAGRARRAEEERPPTGRFIDVEGVNLHYVERGNGLPIVLLHGNGVSLDDFHASGLMARLADRYRVVAFDRPGFGHSTRPRDREWTPAAQATLLRSALRQLGIHRPRILAHSMGTLVALAYALENPEDVTSLVLLAGYYYPEFRLDAVLASPVAWPVIGDTLRYTVTALTSRLLFDRMVELMFAPTDVPPHFVPVLSREMMLRPLQLRANAEDASYMMQAAKDMSGRYQDLRLPVTIITGDGDRVVDPGKHAPRLHAAIPRSKSIVVPECGHMVHYVAADTIAAACSIPS